MHAGLRDFISALEQAGELHRVTAEVNPQLEITEIADRVSRMKQVVHLLDGRTRNAAAVV